MVKSRFQSPEGMKASFRSKGPLCRRFSKTASDFSGFLYTKILPVAVVEVSGLKVGGLGAHKMGEFESDGLVVSAVTAAVFMKFLRDDCIIVY